MGESNSPRPFKAGLVVARSVNFDLGGGLVVTPGVAAGAAELPVIHAHSDGESAASLRSAGSQFRATGTHVLSPRRFTTANSVGSRADATRSMTCNLSSVRAISTVSPLTETGSLARSRSEPARMSGNSSSESSAQNGNRFFSQGSASAFASHMLSGMRTTTRQLTKFVDDVIQEDFVEYKNGGEPPQAPSDFRKASVHEIMSIKMPSGWIGRLRFRTQRFLVSRVSDLLVCSVILANAITIGVEISMELESQDTSVLQQLEHVWLSIYVIELFSRIFALGFQVFRDNWVKFDALLVGIGIFDSFLAEVLIGGDVGVLMVVRMMRLGRLARTLRLLVKFQVLWMLVRGLFSSAGTLLYTFILLSIILYIFSAMGIELITNNKLAQTDEEFAAIAARNFGSLPDTMLTLIQFVCMDSIGAIYRPLIQKDWVLLFYFAGVILVVPIVLMNLVTAIIVNTALEHALQDKEVQQAYEDMRKARLVKQLQQMFRRLDEDNSGQVSRDELLNIAPSDVAILREATSMGDPMEVFNALNVDGEDALNIDDFCDGIWKLATSKATIEVQRMEKQVQMIFDRVKAIESSQKSTSDIFLEVRMSNQQMQKSIASIERLLAGQVVQPAPSSPPASSISRLSSARFRSDVAVQTLDLDPEPTPEVPAAAIARSPSLTPEQDMPASPAGSPVAAVGPPITGRSRFFGAAAAAL